MRYGRVKRPFSRQASRPAVTVALPEPSDQLRVCRGDGRTEGMLESATVHTSPRLHEVVVCQYQKVRWFCNTAGVWYSPGRSFDPSSVT